MIFTKNPGNLRGFIRQLISSGRSYFGSVKSERQRARKDVIEQMIIEGLKPARAVRWSARAGYADSYSEIKKKISIANAIDETLSHAVLDGLIDVAEVDQWSSQVKKRIIGLQ